MSDLLKEAIADAKAVRETALANAKMALEEAFTPQLKSMLSAKLKEDEFEDEDEFGQEEDPLAAQDEIPGEEDPFAALAAADEIPGDDDNAVDINIDADGSEEDMGGDIGGDIGGNMGGEENPYGDDEEEGFLPEKTLQQVSNTSRTVQPIIFSIMIEQSRLSHE